MYFFGGYILMSVLAIIFCEVYIFSTMQKRTTYILIALISAGLLFLTVALGLGARGLFFALCFGILASLFTKMKHYFKKTEGIKK